MTARELAIPGAWEISHDLHPDDRGQFYEWFTQREFATVTGHRFDLQQANSSVSAAGVLRGLHFAQLPPSQAKFVTCVRGSVFDVVVDIRVGSPMYGRWDASWLDDRERRSVYISEGLAHGFLALEDDSMVVYLCSAAYTPEREHTVQAMDPELAIDWPTVGGAAPRMSDRDVQAPTLEQVRESGLLPSWDDTRDFIEQLRRGRG
jgi:dTDP-4-dehydrorhamnose 3,5-epimerase